MYARLWLKGFKLLFDTQDPLMRLGIVLNPAQNVRLTEWEDEI